MKKLRISGYLYFWMAWALLILWIFCWRAMCGYQCENQCIGRGYVGGGSASYAWQPNSCSCWRNSGEPVDHFLL